ncbi:MAG: hypothetical protein ACSHX6_07995 [Akkermansiaceae bacterium]
MKEHPLFPWDHFSDQPRIMRDKKQKRKIYLRASGQMLKSGILLLLLPIFILILITRRSWWKAKTASNRCIGLSVHLESPCDGKTIVPLDQVSEMVDDLGVNQILVRIHLADAENFDSYIEHIDKLSSPNREITVNLIQNRLILDDPQALKNALQKLIPLLKNRTKHLHIGNAYNRRKWAFYHFGEYHKLFRIIRATCKQHAPEMKLIGGAVIDFEIPALLESLFNFRLGKYDGYNTQLYVDRRGAPENTQGGFNFLNKINFIRLIHKLSWKTKGDLWISEINWPLQNSGKFSPCKGSALVDEQTQADYLTRAYLTLIASGRVRTCYWHQLIAPGYGLVDNRPVTPKLRPSYHAFKTLNTLFNNAEVIHFNNGNYEDKQHLYSLKIRITLHGQPTTIQALWSNNAKQQISPITADRWLDQNAAPITFTDSKPIPITSSVIYAINPH